MKSLAEKILNHFKETIYHYPQDRVVENVKKIIQEHGETKVAPDRDEDRDNILQIQIRSYEKVVAAEPNLHVRSKLRQNFDFWLKENDYTDSDIISVMKTMENK